MRLTGRSVRHADHTISHTFCRVRVKRIGNSEPERLARVFDAFPALYRKSKDPSANGQHVYSLQAKYAKRGDGDKSGGADHDGSQINGANATFRSIQP